MAKGSTEVVAAPKEELNGVVAVVDEKTTNGEYKQFCLMQTRMQYLR